MRHLCPTVRMQREVWEPAIEDRCPVRPVRRVGIRAITHAAADDLRYLLILQTVDGFVLPGMHTGPRGVLPLGLSTCPCRMKCTTAVAAGFESIAAAWDPPPHNNNNNNLSWCLDGLLDRIPAAQGGFLHQPVNLRLDLTEQRHDAPARRHRFDRPRGWIQTHEGSTIQCTHMGDARPREDGGAATAGMQPDGS